MNYLYFWSISSILIINEYFIVGDWCLMLDVHACWFMAHGSRLMVGGPGGRPLRPGLGQAPSHGLGCITHEPSSMHQASIINHQIFIAFR